MSTGTASPGTYSFLFTDLEGSSHLWEAYPEAMKSALARHDAILRQAIEANQGRIVKTTGDGCHAVFETAAGAIKAALAAQRTLIGETWAEIGPQPLRVRMGIHTGEAESRAGDYYGSAVNRAARLMSVGHGGQVLVSAVSAELVFDVLPPGTSLLDLGEHRLKDLVRPEHIYQLVHESLPAGFPPLKSLDSYPNNLPIQITSFIGRDREIEEARRLLSTARLITLTGSGGTGKTRLSLQVAADVLPAYTDGVWLVELAPVTDPDLILQTIAGVLELHTVPGIPAFNLVNDYLRSKRTLIILDNCEHLIHACADLADHLLHTCPHLTIIATSREGLNIAGEVSYHVPSLSIPALENRTLELISASESVQLFVERATALNPHFALTEGNAGAIAQICQRLDGIPLALELAAARTRLFSPEQIAARLNDRFRLLTGGSRTALPRQQTLHAMIDWSYDLLSDPERALLRRLSVFVGGWTFDAAEAVCADLDVLSLLELLVNKSLVIMEEDHGEARYRMLETIRQYAREKLIEAGEGETLRDRHLDYLLGLSVEAEPGLRSSQAYEWFECLARDYDNLSAAVEWGQEERPEDALILVGNLLFFWGFAGVSHQQTLHWLDKLLAQVEVRTTDGAVSRKQVHARARGLAVKGLLIMQHGYHPAALQPILEAIELERIVGDPFYLSFALGVRSALAGMSGDLASGRAAMEESANLIRATDEKRWLVVSLTTLMNFENMMGNLTQASQLRHEIRLYLDQVDHPLFLPAMIRLGMDARYRGEAEEARGYIFLGLKIAQKLGSSYFITGMESDLAHLARQSGDLQTAKDAYRKLIWKWKDFGQVPAVAHQLESFAMIAQVEGEAARAARLLGAAEALRQSIQVPRVGDERQEYDDAIAQLHSTLTGAEFNALWSEGRTMDIDQAILYAVTPTGSV